MHSLKSQLANLTNPFGQQKPIYHGPICYGLVLPMFFSDDDQKFKNKNSAERDSYTELQQEYLKYNSTGRNRR